MTTVGAPWSEGGDAFSTEVRIAFAPVVTYRQLVAESAHGSVSRLIARVGTSLLVIGVAVPILAVQRVTLTLVVSTAAFFSFVVAVQVATGLALVASAPVRRVGIMRALDLWFAASLPCNLWIMLAAGIVAIAQRGSPVWLVSAGIPASIWTGVLCAAFSTEALSTSARGAVWRAAIHQVITSAIILSFVAWSAGGWFQIVSAIRQVVG